MLTGGKKIEQVKAPKWALFSSKKLRHKIHSLLFEAS